MRESIKVLVCSFVSLAIISLLLTFSITLAGPHSTSFGNQESTLLYKLSTNPDDPSINLELAELYASHQDFDKSIAYFEITIEKGMATPEVNAAYAFALFRSGKTDEAEEVYLENIDRFADFSSSYLGLAQLYEAKGWTELAEKAYASYRELIGIKTSK